MSSSFHGPMSMQASQHYSTPKTTSSSHHRTHRRTPSTAAPMSMMVSSCFAINLISAFFQGYLNTNEILQKVIFKIIVPINCSLHRCTRRRPFSRRRRARSSGTRVPTTPLVPPSPSSSSSRTTAAPTTLQSWNIPRPQVWRESLCWIGSCMQTNWHISLVEECWCLSFSILQRVIGSNPIQGHFFNISNTCNTKAKRSWWFRL